MDIDRLKRKIKAALRSSSILRKAKRKMERAADGATQEILQNEGLEIISTVTVALHDSGIEVIPWAGTLLGLERERGIIKYDNDLDFGVVADERFSWDTLEDVLTRLGYTKNRQFENQGRITEQKYRKGKLLFDIFALYPVDDETVSAFFYEKYPEESYASPNEFSVRTFFEPKPAGLHHELFGDWPIVYPENAAAILEKHYGPKWRIPDSGWISGGNWEKLPIKGMRTIFETDF